MVTITHLRNKRSSTDINANLNPFAENLENIGKNLINIKSTQNSKINNDIPKVLCTYACVSMCTCHVVSSFQLNMMSEHGTCAKSGKHAITNYPRWHGLKNRSGE